MLAWCRYLSLPRCLAALLLAAASAVHAANPAYFVAPGGSDTGDGSLAAPFASLAHAQQAMRSTGVRTVYIRAGTYALSSPLVLTPADDGETWSYYPADGADSAVLDAGYAIAGGVIVLRGATGVVINGLAIRNFVDYGIFGAPLGQILGGENLVMDCDVGYNSATSWSSAGIAISSMPDTIIASNYVHDVGSQGIAVYAYLPGETINGDLIFHNVVLRAVTRMSDGGAIYTNMHNGNQGDYVRIVANYVADQGSPGTWGVHGIYVDDLSSNVTVAYNIVRAPAPGTGSTSIYGVNAVSAFFVTNGNNNTFTNNIVDLGSSGTVSTAIFAYASTEAIDVGMSGNSFVNNIVVSGFAGGLRTRNSAQSGYAFFQDTADPKGFGYDIRNNLYWNYAAGGGEFSNGSAVSDASPAYVNPLIADAGYRLLPDSPAYRLLGWADLPTRWGPLGFDVAAMPITPPSIPSTVH